MTSEAAREAMTALSEYIDMIIVNEEDAKIVFGIEADKTDVNTGKLNKEGYEEVARKLMEQFRFSEVAITLRESKSASDNDWSGLLYDGKECLFSKVYPVHIVDRIGGGDSFAAGLIYSL